MPDSFEELFDRASRALAAGWAEQALVPATEAVKLQPQRADARILLARAWFGNGGFARAISDARAALALAPTPAEVAAAHEVIGRAALREKDAGTAESSLREARAGGATPVSCALLASVLVDAGRGADAAVLAREDAQREAGQEESSWNATRIAFEALANAIDRGDAAEIQVALGDLCWDAGLPEDAKPRYYDALAERPDFERAADGLRGLAAGETRRPRPKVKAAPRTDRTSVRWARLATSGLCGAVSVYVLFRWEQLAFLGVLRSALVVAGLGVVAALVVVARREELAAMRAAEAGAPPEKPQGSDP